MKKEIQKGGISKVTQKETLKCGRSGEMSMKAGGKESNFKRSGASLVPRKA